MSENNEDIIRCLDISEKGKCYYTTQGQNSHEDTNMMLFEKENLCCSNEVEEGNARCSDQCFPQVSSLDGLEFEIQYDKDDDMFKIEVDELCPLHSHNDCGTGACPEYSLQVRDTHATDDTPDAVDGVIGVLKHSCLQGHRGLYCIYAMIYSFLARRHGLTLVQCIGYSRVSSGKHILSRKERKYLHATCKQDNVELKVVNSFDISNTFNILEFNVTLAYVGRDGQSITQVIVLQADDSGRILVPMCSENFAKLGRRKDILIGAVEEKSATTISKPNLSTFIVSKLATEESYFESAIFRGWFIAAVNGRLCLVWNGQLKEGESVPKHLLFEMIDKQD